MGNNIYTILKESNLHRVYDEAKKQAERSTLRAFKTGAIIYADDKEPRILGKGCSHISEQKNKPSVHAEEHAIACMIPKAKDIIYYVNIFILSVGRSGNPTFSSRPCFSCTEKIVFAKRKNTFQLFHNVVYLERANNGDWTLNIEKPWSLYERAVEHQMTKEKYAREMRIT